MKSLQLEWKHLDVNGQTCRRCADTGEAVLEVVADLIEELRPQVTFPRSLHQGQRS